MSRAWCCSRVVMIAACVVLAGCGRSPEPTSSGAPGAAASTPQTAASVAGTRPGDVHVTTSRYRIDIAYPQLPAADAALVTALHQAGDAARQRFLKSLPDPKQFPGLADRQFQLKLDFSIVARMPAFVSVRERGMADTGGAHPIPVDATFVYAAKAGKIVSLADLFTDPAQARQRLAKVARKQLETHLLAKVPGGARTSPKARKEWMANMRGMIEQGTQATARNFSEFAVLAGAGDQASGLLLIFPPYQVAPYVYGSQTVQVPVDVFADLLKPAYRDAFDAGAPAPAPAPAASASGPANTPNMPA